MLKKLNPCHTSAGIYFVATIANKTKIVPTPVHINVVKLTLLALCFINIQTQANKQIAKTNISKKLLPTISPKPTLPLLSTTIEAIHVTSSGKLVITPNNIPATTPSDKCAFSLRITHNRDKSVVIPTTPTNNKQYKDIVRAKFSLKA
ncbi:MAG: hypothetical protein MJ233_01440 [Mycoplasmoidaceae bacterium]|nr:hypothetical protein [Mycoplasmoidaceae bacterium]